MRENYKVNKMNTYHKNSILRISLAALAVILQVGVLILLIVYLGKNATWIELSIQIVAAILVIKIYSEEKTSAMKTPWIILILVLPVVGVSLYYLIGGNLGSYWMKKKFNKVDSAILNYREKDDELIESIKVYDVNAYGVVNYISKNTGYPVYKNTKIDYFDDTRQILTKILDDISDAKHFIFMEYFAIENSTLWEKILDALEKKISEGVEVRILYDDVGSIGYVSSDFQKLMQQKGINCRIFNQVKAVFNMFMNNRDHRKITIIDGKIGYTGGFNLTNEYFNITHPYGWWKDSGVRIEGSAVNSLTAAFLEMWIASLHEGEESNYCFEEYFKAEKIDGLPENSFVQPYGDSPLDNLRAGEDVYLSLIEKAADYCYFMTPYLIITEEMIRSLTLAAKRGVDVRIVVPGIPDKKIIYSITRSFYNSLAAGGVKIYEWRPGFVHAKVCLVDGKMATCGSINLDYRSLYHHFEFGCLFNDESAIESVERDFVIMFVESKEVSDKYNTTKYSKKFSQKFLRIFAELL